MSKKIKEVIQALNSNEVHIVVGDDIPVTGCEWTTIAQINKDLWAKVPKVTRANLIVQINRLTDDLIDARYTIESVKSGTWISAEQMLPAINTSVDVWIQAYDCAFRGLNFVWTGSRWENHSNGDSLEQSFGNVGMIVTHWRPIPSAPLEFEGGHGDRSLILNRP